MSEPEGFLARWARRKREAEETAPAPVSPPADETAAPSPESEAPEAGLPTPGFDLSALPPIESITATTDIRGFLAPGVPPELTRAALRRAWVADPKIRDFIGIAENQWDFTAPDSIPGFGPLGPLDDVARLVAGVMGDGPTKPETPTEVAGAEEGAAALAASETAQAPTDAVEVRGEHEPAEIPSAAPPPAEDVQCGEVTSAAHKSHSAAAASDAPARRSHGGALPK